MLDLRSGRILRLATQATHIATKQLSNDASKPRAKTSKQNKLLPKIDGHKYSVKKSPFASAPTELTLRRRRHEHTARSPPSQSSSRCQNSDAEWGSQTLRQACYRENPESAMCVQNLNDSRGLAIRITYRISLRSSSLWEPRHPPLRIWFLFRSYLDALIFSCVCGIRRHSQLKAWLSWVNFSNDPSAGSPTETLLRLLLPLSSKICLTFRDASRASAVRKAHRTTRNR